LAVEALEDRRVPASHLPSSVDDLATSAARAADLTHGPTLTAAPNSLHTAATSGATILAHGGAANPGAGLGLKPMDGRLAQLAKAIDALIAEVQQQALAGAAGISDAEISAAVDVGNALADLIRQYPSVTGDPFTDTSPDPGKAKPAVAGAPGSLQAVSRAVVDILSQLGIVAPGLGAGTSGPDTNAFLAALHGNSQGDGNIPVVSLYPSWWPTVASPLDTDGSQVQNRADLAGAGSPDTSNNGKTTSPGSLSDFMSYLSGFVQNFGAAGAAVGGGIGTGVAGPVGGLNGAGAGTVVGGVVGIVLGTIAYIDQQWGHSAPVQVDLFPKMSDVQPKPDPTHADVKVALDPSNYGKTGTSEFGLSSWSTSAPVEVKLDPSNYGKSSMPNPEADGPARGSHSLSLVDMFTLNAMREGQVALYGEWGKRQITQRDIDRLISAVVTSVMSKVNPNPDAEPRGSTPTPPLDRGQPPPACPLDPMPHGGTDDDGRLHHWKPQPINPIGPPRHDLADAAAQVSQASARALDTAGVAATARGALQRGDGPGSLGM
jgi:hypothetical protein